MRPGKREREELRKRLSHEEYSKATKDVLRNYRKIKAGRKISSEVYRDFKRWVGIQLGYEPERIIFYKQTVPQRRKSTVVDRDSETFPESNASMLTENDQIVISDVDISDLEECSTGIDVSRLREGEELNDKIVNEYMELIVSRSRNSTSLPSVFAFESHFFTVLKTKGVDKVIRWAKNFDQHDMVFIPVNQSRHWFLIQVEISSREISVFNSINISKQFGQAGKAYRDMQLVDQFMRKVIEGADWKHTIRENIPFQDKHDNVNCGVYMCLFAELLSRRCGISFTGKDIPYLRQNMADEIVNRELDESKHSETSVYPSQIVRTVDNCSKDRRVVVEDAIDLLDETNSVKSDIEEDGTLQQCQVVVEEDTAEVDGLAEQASDNSYTEEDEALRRNWRKIHVMQSIPEDDEDEDEEDDKEDRDWKRR